MFQVPEKSGRFWHPRPAEPRVTTQIVNSRSFILTSSYKARYLISFGRPSPCAFWHRGAGLLEYRSHLAHVTPGDDIERRADRGGRAARTDASASGAGHCRRAQAQAPIRSRTTACRRARCAGRSCCRVRRTRHATHLLGVRAETGRSRGCGKPDDFSGRSGVQGHGREYQGAERARQPDLPARDTGHADRVHQPRTHARTTRAEPEELGRSRHEPAHRIQLADYKYARAIVDELMPVLYKEYNISKDPERHGIGGASSGAIAAFTVAWQRPNDFRKVLSIVGSFVNLGDRGGDTYADIVRKSEKKPLRIFLQDGRNDNRGTGRGGEIRSAPRLVLPERAADAGAHGKRLRSELHVGDEHPRPAHGRSHSARDDAMAVARPSSFDGSG